ncbi:TIGR02301 family protein [Mesorhizobium sp. SB112]|uniref:TIGR02301 family protein n=1 Tax=Mesorhizobium sp. SB112 TaxID=3151853 RepID=UPI00326315BC
MNRVALLLSAFLIASPAYAVEAPFERGLMRLSEVLGSLHFLRNLCGEEGSRWRDQMETLLEAEKPDVERRARLIASFNRGYRSFEGTYSSCTSSATEAINRYIREGETLTRDIAAKYGN